MAVMMKCAACGTEVEFQDDSPAAEATCPGCEVRVRRRAGDEQMAMPVSMTLPDQFQPLDLGSLGKQSTVLVERYKREGAHPNEPTGGQVDATLARALESLAHSIGHLEARLSKQEQRSATELPDHAHGAENGHQPGGGMLPDGYADGYPDEFAHQEPLSPPPEGEAVVQLEPEDAKAQPLGAPVLVRREAAQVAHHYRRENQKHWDHRGREQVKVGWFQQMMEVAPKTTVTVTILLALGIVGATIYVMEFGNVFAQDDLNLPPVEETSSMGQLWADDPEAGQAEMVARGFLSATSAKVAKPFVYQSDLIQRKFEELYKPIQRPEDYKLVLQSRAVAPNGSSVFAYRVWMEDEQPRMLVVLPEGKGKMPKVYWEFFAEVGDYSWEEFMDLKPSEPAKMRAWAYKGNSYVAPYNDQEWQCYILHDYSERHVLHAYARKGEGADWRLSNELETKPVKFGRRQEVMAQVIISFMSEVENPGEDRIYVAEIKDVPLVSWLPQQFVPPPPKD
jgi:hypothetical protein